MQLKEKVLVTHTSCELEYWTILILVSMLETVK